MKVFLIVVVTGIVTALSGCDGEAKLDDELTAGTIVDVHYEECYCCPGTVIEIDGSVYISDFLPQDSALVSKVEGGQFPIDVLVKTSDYTGDCGNHDIDINDIELAE